MLQVYLTFKKVVATFLSKLMSIDYSHFKSEDATFLKNGSVMCKKLCVPKITLHQSSYLLSDGSAVSDCCCGVGGAAI